MEIAYDENQGNPTRRSKKVREKSSSEAKVEKYFKEERVNNSCQMILEGSERAEIRPFKLAK